MRKPRSKTARLRPLAPVWCALAAAALAIGCRDPAPDAESAESIAPSGPGVVRFAALGDAGTGDLRQRDVSRAIFAEHERDAFDSVLLLGDNVYVDRKNPPPFEDAIRDYFEVPYAELIEAKVPFYAILGNHDVGAGYASDEQDYPPFNMGGKSYYCQPFAKGLVEVFFLNFGPIKNGGDPEQVAWLDKALAASGATWKIVALHQSPYSTAEKYGPEPRLRAALEPVLRKRGVAIVLAGHNHVYERIGPIDGVHYVTAGSGGKLRPGDLPENGKRAAGYDLEAAFATLEFCPTHCMLRAINGLGDVVDEVAIPAR